jgi:hypothetical protein
VKAIAHSPGIRRRELFAATAHRWAITPAAAEKDFWIVWVLQQLFALPEWGRRLRFKGGTSLSKAYSVIERFSEDIDLILDWSDLTEQDPAGPRSKTQQGLLNEAINHSAQTVICEQLLPAVQQAVTPVCTANQEPDDPHTIAVQYPAEFAPGYLRPVVRLEIGPLAAMLPMQWRSVQSYAAASFPRAFTSPDVQVPTISIERTVWEKLTILHAEAHRPADKPLPARYARHYYDVHCLARSPYAGDALADTSLLAEVVAFKQKFYPAGWASYQTATPAGLQLQPAPVHTRALVRDYSAMAEMIFGAVPSFSDITQTLSELEAQLHNQHTEK